MNSSTTVIFLDLSDFHSCPFLVPEIQGPTQSFLLYIYTHLVPNSKQTEKGKDMGNWLHPLTISALLNEERASSEF